MRDLVLPEELDRGRRLIVWVRDNLERLQLDGLPIVIDFGPQSKRDPNCHRCRWSRRHRGLQRVVHSCWNTAVERRLADPEYPVCESEFEPGQPLVCPWNSVTIGFPRISGVLTDFVCDACGVDFVDHREHEVGNVPPPGRERPVVVVALPPE